MAGVGQRSLVLLLLLQVLQSCLSLEDTMSSEDLKDIVTNLARQVQLERLGYEEAVRSYGGSGIKQQRTDVIGSKSYKTRTHTGMKIAGVHDHADVRHTVGMGESIYVLNGVEFRCRHNDYKMVMPHRTSKEYNAVENIPRPEVPPAVLEKETVDEQVEEMKKWFQAWGHQDHSVRDYRPYFRPALCYLEGAWTVATYDVEEPFESDRHELESDTWEGLNEHIGFNAYVGRKNLRENLAWLPRKLWNISESGHPTYAQWNYRILCHPLKDDLPFSSLAQEDDLQARFLYKRTLEEWAEKRGARFRLDSSDYWKNADFTLQDELMQQIPGRDNYPADIAEEGLGDVYTNAKYKSKKVLNTGYFNRRYNIGEKDASGSDRGKRGFSDPNLYVAETTQDRIAPMYLHLCEKDECYETTRRVTYAIPLEVIYMTPLENWNPHKIQYMENGAFSKQNTDNRKRNGGFTLETAYRNSGRTGFYHTPSELYKSTDDDEYDAADTTVPQMGFLGEDGQVHNMTASGIRMFFPAIENVGRIRQRWPVMPVHGEASSVWKELNVLKAIVMDLKTYEKYLYKPLPSKCDQCSSSSSKGSSETSDSKSGSGEKAQLLWMLLRFPYATDGHTHLVNVTGTERNSLKKGGTVTVRSTKDSRHRHDVEIQKIDGKYIITLADGAPPPTSDGHTSHLKWQKSVYDDGTVTERDNGKRRRRRSLEEDIDDLNSDFDLE